MTAHQSYEHAAHAGGREPSGPGSPSGAGTHARVESLLARYPGLSPGELEELLGWFEREASAHDVATIASNEGIRDGYRRFRAQHIDAFSLKDVFRAIAFVTVLGGLLLGVVWLAP